MAAMAARRTPSSVARDARRCRVWTFGSTTAWDRAHRGWRTEPQYITVIYLDDEPLVTTEALAPIVEERWQSAAVRPIFAGPLRTMVSWEAWP